MALLISIFRLDNRMHDFFITPSALSSSKTCNMQSKKGRDIAISDGSHKNKWGTASWQILSDTNEYEQWAGLHVTPGRKYDQSAFRSEIGGICAMSVAIELICKFFRIPNGSVSFGSDCKSALYYIFDENKTLHG
jgi:hypothetical protein